MGETLTERRRVQDEGLRVVNCSLLAFGPLEKAPTNYVPAVAVIRRAQALSGIIGRKAFVGGFLSLALKTPT